MIQTSFWSADGKPISAEEFLQRIYGKLPEFFKNEGITSDDIDNIRNYVRENEVGRKSKIKRGLIAGGVAGFLCSIISYQTFAKEPLNEYVEERMAKREFLQKFDRDCSGEIEEMEFWGAYYDAGGRFNNRPCGEINFEIQTGKDFYADLTSGLTRLYFGPKVEVTMSPKYAQDLAGNLSIPECRK